MITGDSLLTAVAVSNMIGLEGGSIEESEIQKLSEKEFCDKLVVLTSDIIEKNFSELEVEYLAQRIKSGLEVNELTKDKILFLNKDVIDRFNISDDTKRNTKKKRICIGIAKFYVKIAHLFAAIMMTINPVYSYKDENGNIIKANLMERDKIPKNVKRNIYKLNVCENVCSIFFCISRITNFIIIIRAVIIISYINNFIIIIII
jgi:hypothetical protein